MKINSTNISNYKIGENQISKIFLGTLLLFQTAYTLINLLTANKSYDVSFEEQYPYDVDFSNDGTKMYISGGDHRIYQYNLSIAWDVSTASYSTKNLWVEQIFINPMSFDFNNDGTKIYIVSTDESVYQFTLSTAWDISTATYDNKSFSTSIYMTIPQSIRFNNDGTKFFVSGTNVGSPFGYWIIEYTLFTPWDISSAAYTGYLNTQTEDNYIQSISFSDDGTRMIALGTQNDLLYQYTLSTPWQIDTAVYDNISSNSYSPTVTNPTAIQMKDNGDRMYIIDYGASTIKEFSM